MLVVVLGGGRYVSSSLRRPEISTNYPALAFVSMLDCKFKNVCRPILLEEVFCLIKWFFDLI